MFDGLWSSREQHSTNNPLAFFHKNLLISLYIL